MREGWKEVKLGDISDIYSGFAFKSKEMTTENNGIPLVKIKNIFDRKVSNEFDSYLLEKYDNPKFNKYRLLQGDILVAMTGQGSVGRIGKMHCVNDKIYVNQRVGIVRVNEKLADKEFVYQQLATKDNETIYFNLALGAGQPNLSPADIGNKIINLPPLETQKKIASILSGYDDLIENNLKRIKILEEMAQQTYEEWFVRMRFPGHDASRASASVNEETSEIERSRNVPEGDALSLPKGWEKVKLGELWEIQSSKRIFLSDYVDSGIPFFRGKEITQKSENSTISDLIYIREDKFKEIKKKYGAPSTNDILITAVGTLGNLYMVRETDEDFYFKDGNLIWFKSNDNYSSYYLLYYLKSTSFQNYINNTAIGSSQKALTIKGMKESDIIKPSKDLIDSFDEIIIPISKSIENLQNQNQRLREARDILLPRLMMGMVEV
ncbi:restriction endonuclease subunit S [Empedobacter falsenii]